MPAKPIPHDAVDDEGRHLRTLQCVRALTPIIVTLLHEGHTRTEIARTLRVQADLVVGQADDMARALREAAEKLMAGAQAEGRPVELRVRVVKASGRGVQVRLVDGHSPDLFWLPAAWPAQWLAVPEIGEIVSVRVPRWLASRHAPVVALRCGGQQVPAFHKYPGIDPIKGKEILSMTDETGRGALFRIPEDQRKNEKWPEMRGDIVTPSGEKLELAGWSKVDKNGKRYLSLTCKAAQQRQQEAPAQSQPNACAQANRGDDPIPF
jgi:hypothetical protein